MNKGILEFCNQCVYSNQITCSDKLIEQGKFKIKEKENYKYNYLKYCLDGEKPVLFLNYTNNNLGQEVNIELFELSIEVN